MKLGNFIVGLGFLFSLTVVVCAQEPSRSLQGTDHGDISVRSNLVVVPTLVKTKKGDVVFSLEATDFSVTDDGVPQRVQVEPDTHGQPVALVILVQTGKEGAAHLDDYRALEPILEAIVGGVPHRVAIVTFDSKVHLVSDFNEDLAVSAGSLETLTSGDQGAAILDGLKFATTQLGIQPLQYRRTIVLLSETVDGGSKTTLDEALRAVDDTNTSIYSFGFSSLKSALTHEGAKLPNPFSRTKYSSTPYKAGGCMSREEGADPDAHGSREKQALDCTDDLLPPLRLARMAYIGAVTSMRHNVPETVARVTGGEYAGFKDAKSLRRSMIGISNDFHNDYLLSFQPQKPHTGLHALSVTITRRKDLVVRARGAYWIGNSEPH